MKKLEEQQLENDAKLAAVVKERDGYFKTLEKMKRDTEAARDQACDAGHEVRDAVTEVRDARTEIRDKLEEFTKERKRVTKLLEKTTEMIEKLAEETEKLNKVKQNVLNMHASAIKLLQVKKTKIFLIILGWGVSICLYRVSIKSLKLDTFKKLVSTIEKNLDIFKKLVSTIEKSRSSLDATFPSKKSQSRSRFTKSLKFFSRSCHCFINFCSFVDILN